MNNSSLVKILKTFTEKEIKELDLFLKSPLFVSPKSAEPLCRLLLYITRGLSENLESKLLKTKADIFVFGKEKRVSGKIEKLMSKLRHYVREYIKWKYQQETEAILPSWQPEIDFYKSRGLNSFHENQLLKAKESLIDLENLDHHYYWKKLLLAHEQMDYNRLAAPKKQIDDYDYESYCLDEYYLLRKLRIAVAVMALELQQEKVKHRDFISLENLLSQLDTTSLTTLPMHRIYICAYEFLKKFHEVDKSPFEALRKILEEEGGLLSFEKFQMFQTLLRIYAVGRLNKGDESLLLTTFDLYKKHLELGYLYFEGKIHSLTLMNLVVMGLKCSDFDWVDRFLKQHEALILDKTGQEDIINLNRAIFNFYQKDYDKTLDLLPDTMDNIHNRLKARRLEIMVYFEQKSVLLDSKMEAFKIYIFRLSKKEMPEIYEKLNNAFIDILRQILQPKTLKNPIRIDKLLRKIEETPSLAERDWLVDKLKELY